MNDTDPQIECHPLQPFMPDGAKLLMLGSFPPKHERWSMEFFYPNFQNDMWRIVGLLFYGDRNHFVVDNERRFCYETVVEFCTRQGIAIYDTASAVKRLNDNASDKFLEIVDATDIPRLLEQLPECRAVAATGQKASEIVCEIMGCELPKIGEKSKIVLADREIYFYRMPSSSRAYPLSLEKKAEFYRSMFEQLQMLELLSK